MQHAGAEEWCAGCTARLTAEGLVCEICGRKKRNDCATGCGLFCEFCNSDPRYPGRCPECVEKALSYRRATSILQTRHKFPRDVVRIVASYLRALPG